MKTGEFIPVSADKTQITICARLYSEYVIAYQTGGSPAAGIIPVNPTPVKATSANTGDAGVLLYGVTAALSLTGTAWLGAKAGNTKSHIAKDNPGGKLAFRRLLLCKRRKLTAVIKEVIL